MSSGQAWSSQHEVRLEWQTCVFICQGNVNRKSWQQSISNSLRCGSQHTHSTENTHTCRELLAALLLHCVTSNNPRLSLSEQNHWSRDGELMNRINYLCSFCWRSDTDHGCVIWISAVNRKQTEENLIHHTLIKKYLGPSVRFMNSFELYIKLASIWIELKLIKLMWCKIVSHTRMKKLAKDFCTLWIMA